MALDAEILVIGGGPAGLMAADVISAAGHAVAIFDRMPTFGRRLLMAGRGGLNLTHSEPVDKFLDRYGPARERLEPIIGEFAPSDLVRFVEALGEETFVGTSGRIFPRSMKASPLLRAWLARLVKAGATFHAGWRWLGLEAIPGGGWRHHFRDAHGMPAAPEASTAVLALGGASWPRLGADGGWVAGLREQGVRVAPFQASNAGVLVDWSAHLRERAAGSPIKRVRLSCRARSVRGEVVISASGIEGGAIYALTPSIRDALAGGGPVELTVDLRPDMLESEIVRRLEARPRGKLSHSSWLKKALRCTPTELLLLHEGQGALPHEPQRIAARIKALPIAVRGLAGIERAISSAGGIHFDEVGDDLELRRMPGVFIAGEMLDWEAPTGGYLLQACFATGFVAGKGALARLENAAGARSGLAREP